MLQKKLQNENIFNHIRDNNRCGCFIFLGYLLCNKTKYKMKKILLILLAICAISCAPAKFVVVSVETSKIADNCIFVLKPINKQAKNKSVDGLFTSCGEFGKGDTITLSRKDFTNY